MEPFDKADFDKASRSATGPEAKEGQAGTEKDQGLIDNLPGMAYRCLNDQAWTLEFASAGCRELTGYDPSVLIGDGQIKYADLIHEEDRDAVWRTVQEALASKSPFTLTYRIRTAAGQQKWVLEKGYQVSGSSRSATTLEGFITDITRQKRAEQALRESEEEISRIFHSSPELIAVMEIESGRYLQVNDSYTRLLGYRRDEVLRRSAAELRIWNDPTVPERLVELLEQHGEVRNLEVLLRKKSGEIFPALVSAAPIVLDGVRCCVKLIMDITELKSTQVALEKSQKLFSVFMSHLPAAAFIKDESGRLIFANEYLRDLFGWTDWKGKSASDLLPGPVGEKMASEDEIALQGGPLVVSETIQAVDDLRQRHFQTLKFPISTREGRLVGGIAVDITERREIEEKLRASEERLRVVFENAPDACYLIDLDGKFVDGNQAAEKMVGGPREHFIGCNFFESGLLDKRDVQKAKEGLELNRQGLPVGPAEFHLNRRDGGKTVAEIRAYPVRVGRETLVLGVARDITGQKQAEEALKASTERFRALFENAPIGIYRSTPEGRITMANPKLLELLGCDSFESLSSRNLEEEGFSIDSPRDLFKSAIEREGEVRGMESGWTKADGTIVWLRENAWAVRSEAGNILFYEGMVEDTTERRRAEEERRKLEAINVQTMKLESLGLLAGGIAHDFNNILTGIFGLTQLAIEESPAESQLRQDLQQLLEIGQRAKKLVQQILFFSRKRDAEHHPMHVGPVVEEAMKLLRASLPATIEIRTSLRTDRDVVLADSTQIQQVVVNLCTNAAYAMREKGGLLEVSIDRVEDATGLATHGPKIGPGPCLVLGVRDTGSGMPPEVMQRLFEPFFTTKPIGQGTGMGLPVIYGIVTATGGAIRVESEPGSGSTFEIFLPLAAGEPDAASKQTLAQARPADGETILLVDDEEAILETHSRILKRMGYEVVSCKDGAEALEVFSCDPDRFDLVITDQTMPRLTGDRLSRHLLKKRPDLPIVLCTGYSDMITAEQSREQGIKAFLLKPIEMDELAATIRSAFKKNGNGTKSPH